MFGRGIHRSTVCVIGFWIALTSLLLLLACEDSNFSLSLYRSFLNLLRISWLIRHSSRDMFLIFFFFFLSLSSAYPGWSINHPTCHSLFKKHPDWWKNTYVNECPWHACLLTELTCGYIATTVRTGLAGWSDHQAGLLRFDCWPHK